MLEGTELVSQLIIQYPVMEKTYARIDSDLSKVLRDSLLSFYCILLKFQIRAITYFDKNKKVPRALTGLNPISVADLLKLRSAVIDAKAKVDQNISIVHYDFMKCGIEELKLGQNEILTGQKEQLAITRNGILSLAQSTGSAIKGQTAFMQTQFVELDARQQKRMEIMMNEVVNQWQGPLDSIMKAMMKADEEKRLAREQNKLAEIRRWLSVALPDKDHDDAKAKRPISLGGWLLNHRKFVEWNMSPASSILWVYGLAGTGKTNLSYRVIDSLQSRPEKPDCEPAHGVQDESHVVDGDYVSVPMNGEEAESEEPGYAVETPLQDLLQAEDVPKDTQLYQASSNAHDASPLHPDSATIRSEEASPEIKNPKKNGRLAFFYCSNDKAASDREEVFSRADPEEAFRSIVSQLATAKRGKNIRIVKKLKEYEARYGTKSDTHRTLNYSECADVILSVSLEESVVIVIDALDECDHERCGELIDKLKEIIGSTPINKSAYPVKVFVTTRSFAAIEKDLDSDHSLEVTAENNRADVRKFIGETLQQRSDDLLQGTASPKLMKEIEDTLAERAQNMFLYASLLLQQLCDRNHYDDEDSVRKKLERLPRTLTDVYDKVIEEIHDDKNNSARLCAIAQNTLRWLLRAQRPLECDVLLEAVSSIGEKAKAEEILRWCRTLVVKENTVFEFAHYSIREYLQKKPEYDPSQSDLIATQSCLRILNTSFEAENLNATLSNAQKCFSDYASLYWPVHYEGIEIDYMDDRREPIKVLLRNFLLQGHGKTNKYEHWRKTAQKMANELGDKEYLSAKLKTLQADPPTPLFAACVFGFPDIIGRFGRDLHGLDKCNAHGQSALSLAIENRKLGTVKALLSRRFPADVNRLNVKAVEQFAQFDIKSPPPFIHYASPLQTAASQGYHDIAEYLIERGAHVDLVAGYYGSALQAAALHGHESIVSLLLSKGAEPNSQGGYYGNALQAAAANGHVDVINLLLENKTPALVSTPGGPFGSALMAAVCSGSSEAAWMILLDESADPNVKSKIHGSPLEKAASMGYKEVVDLLLDKDANADLQPRENPLHILHYAAMHGMIKLARHCLEKKCSVDMVTLDAPKYFPRPIPEDAKKMTPLSIACAEGQTVMVKFLLDQGASVEISDVPAAALWVAAQRGHADIVDMLIERFETKHGTADAHKFVTQCPPMGGHHPVLFIAVWTGNVRIVRKLLDKKSKYENNWFKASPLLACATFNRPKIASLLLEYAKKGDLNGPLNIDARAQNGCTALFEACQSDLNHHDVARILLDAGADWSIPNGRGMTVLHKLVWAGDKYKAFLAHILEKAKKTSHTPRFKSFLDFRNEAGRTALRVAAEQNRSACLELLLAYDADWSMPGYLKVTALHAACWEGHETVFSLLLQAARKASPSRLKDFLDTRNNDGKTALAYAVERDRLAFVKTLLGDGAAYEIANVRETTVLHLASFEGKLAIATHLLEFASKDPDQARFKRFLNARNSKGKTALMDAAETGRPLIIERLLNNSADYTLPDNNGFTALHYCAFRNKRAAVERLLEIASRDRTTNSNGQQRFENFLNQKCKGRAVSALCDVATQGHKEVIDLLVNRYGAAYDSVDSQNYSPLHHAYGRNHPAAAEIILRYAASDTDKQRFRKFVELRDHRNKTVWEVAAERKDERWHQIMRQCGAAP